MDGVTILAASASILGAIVLKLLASEIGAWAPLLARWLIDQAAARIPKQDRARYREEWHAHLNECPGLLAKLWHAFGCMRAAFSIGRIARIASAAKVVQVEQAFLAVERRLLAAIEKGDALVSQLERLRKFDRFKSDAKIKDLTNRLRIHMRRPHDFLNALRAVSRTKLLERCDESLEDLRMIDRELDGAERAISRGISLIKSATPASPRPSPRSPSRPT